MSNVAAVACCEHFSHLLICMSLMAGAAASGGVAASQTDELTFLRGLVMTNAEGEATFHTVYPGTYEGRTPHIHVKVIMSLLLVFCPVPSP